MPCDIGYRSYERIRIPEPQPETFVEKVEAPTLDADLLEKLGVEDPEFLDWATNDLNIGPLLEEALKRAQAAVDTGGVTFTIGADNMLEARGSFISASEKRRLEEATSAMTQRWQFEVLGIVTELLDYTVTITTTEDGFVLEAEEAGKTHPCDYIKVSVANGEAELVFEHFKSAKALDVATAKFKLLAEKLGVKIVGGAREVVKGEPFPTESQLREGHTHSHGHAHAHKH